jgi:hypothetical protein
VDRKRRAYEYPPVSLCALPFRSNHEASSFCCGCFVGVVRVGFFRGARCEQVRQARPAFGASSCAFRNGCGCWEQQPYVGLFRLPRRGVECVAKTVSRRMSQLRTRTPWINWALRVHKHHATRERLDSRCSNFGVGSGREWNLGCPQGRWCPMLAGSMQFN